MKTLVFILTFMMILQASRSTVAEVYADGRKKHSSVNMSPQNVFISRVPGGVFKKFYGAKHEIYMSPNDVMEKYLNTIFSFLEG